MVLHTPYDGSSRPFTIGLSPLSPLQWLDEDQNLVSYLDEKLNLYKTLPDQVLVQDEGTRAAQSEVLDLVQAHMLERFPVLYVRVGDVMHIAGRHTVKLDDGTLSPIAIAGLLVQEDLVLMRKSPEGWKLAAASVCFPSAWNLREKFKRPLAEIHAPVPGFNAGTRNAALIERMFDNLRVEQPVLRWNWSLHDDMRLHHPDSHTGESRRFGDGDLRGAVILRLERQTLRKLPKSGDILFTIRIYLDPLEALERHPEGRTLARAIDDQLQGMSDAEAEYKGIAGERARLSARLHTIIDRAST